MIHGPVLTTGPQKESIDVSPGVLQDIWLTPHGTELESQRVNLKREKGLAHGNPVLGWGHSFWKALVT